ncbi:hypothetical protein E8E11_007529 [Didymella keratinophila]|nr:hypothetical protein E8E11_007529 [Didymella keratinophila]
MSQRPRSRNRIGKAPHQRGRQQSHPAHHSDAEPGHDGAWVAAPLLSAMDDMERHVQEMLDHDPHLAAEIKPYIVREIKRRMKEKVNDIVDTAIVARMRRLAASQRADKSCIDELQAARKRNDQTIRELDALHCHEHTLNTTLVDCLFNIPSLAEGQPEMRFSDTTFGLEGTDSVNSVLVSHVEVLGYKGAKPEAGAEVVAGCQEEEAQQLLAAAVGSCPSPFTIRKDFR